MKKFRILFAVLLSLLMIAAITGCMDNTDGGDIGGGGTIDDTWHGNWEGPDEGGGPVEPEVHLCSHACYVCGLCLDTGCEQPECAEKCYETDAEHRTEYTFNGTDSRVKLEGGVSVNGDYIGNINQNPNVVITYRIIAPEATSVCLGATVSEMNEAHVVTAATPITVNGKPFYSRGEIPAGPTVWTTFITGWLGCVDLEEGVNTIVISNPHADGQQYNFKDIKMLSSVELEWISAKDEHDCTSKNEAGKCTDYTCNREECLDKDETGWKTLNISGKDDEVLKYYIDNSGKEVDLWNDAPNEQCIGQLSGNNWGQKIIWSFDATEETNVRLSLETSVNITNSRFAEAWDLTMDGQPIVTEGYTASPEGTPPSGVDVWSTYTFGKVAYVTVPAGNHTFMMVHKSTVGYNLRSLEISYANGVITKAQAQKPEVDDPLEPEAPVTEGDEYVFEGETAAMTDGGLGSINFNNADTNAKNNTSLGNINNNMGATLTFTVFAAADCKTGLYVSLALGGSPVENIFTVTVNGKNVYVPPTFTATGATDWQTYEEYWLANADLAAGQPNKIVLTVTGGCGNFDYLKVLAPRAVTDTPDVPDVPADPDSPITEGDEYVFEGETAAMTGDTVTGVPTEITVNTNDPNALNNTSLGQINDNRGATLTFTVNAEADCKAGLYVSLAFGSDDVENIFTLQVNGVTVDIPTAFHGKGGWVTYEEHWLANVELLDGRTNTIVLTVTGGCGNFDYMKLVAPCAVTTPVAA